MGVSKSFTKLLVWEKAHKLVLSIYQEAKFEAKIFPKEETFGLVSQLKRAAVSIPANIAEGYKRKGIKDKIRFYNIAQSSLEEVRYYLILSKDLNYLKDESLNELLEEISKMLESYIKKISQTSF